MKIIIDEDILDIENFFSSPHSITRLPGRAIQQADLKKADALIVRAVTKVDATLLQDTPITFVGSVTAGVDHLDQVYLKENNITCVTAQGCNTNAVAEYVVSVLATLPQLPKRLAIIGVGRIGQRVADICQYLGIEVVLYDPPREKRDSAFISASWAEIREVDMISLHVPLTQTGEYPTVNMIDNDFLLRQKKNTLLVNTARGEIVHSVILEKLKEKKIMGFFDVWPNEPHIPLELLQCVTMSTPHIAGYSKQSKKRGAWMIATALEKYTAKNNTVNFENKCIDFKNKIYSWREVVLSLYDPRKESAAMKALLLSQQNNKKSFDTLRKAHTLRDEFSYVTLKNIQLSPQDTDILEKLGFQVVKHA